MVMGVYRCIVGSWIRGTEVVLGHRSASRRSPLISSKPVYPDQSTSTSSIVRDPTQLGRHRAVFHKCSHTGIDQRCLWTGARPTGSVWIIDPCWANSRILRVCHFV